MSKEERSQPKDGKMRDVPGTETAGQTAVLPKLRRWYTNLAVIALNSFLILVVILLCLDWALGVYHRSEVYSRHFKADSYTLSSPEEIHQIGVEFDQMGERESFIYNPWTTFTERPFKGELLNIEDVHSYPTRATAPCRELGPNQKDLLIWMFGGSTMLGWGVSDANTVPSHFQRELQAALDDYRVRVVNHGHAYYFSSLELSLYVALLRKDERPDMVVFLDGLNDVSRIYKGSEDPHFWFQAAKGWESERRKRYDPGASGWFAINAGFPISRIVRRLNLSGNNETGDDQTESKWPTDQKAVDRVLEVMGTNYEMADAISTRLGIDVFIFLQPIPNQREKRKSYGLIYPALREEARKPDSVRFYDISHPLEPLLEQPYVDDTHYSDMGSKIVAQRMVEVIVPTVR